MPIESLWQVIQRRARIRRISAALGRIQRRRMWGRR